MSRRGIQQAWCYGCLEGWWDYDKFINPKSRRINWLTFILATIPCNMKTRDLYINQRILIIQYFRKYLLLPSKVLISVKIRMHIQQVINNKRSLYWIKKYGRSILLFHAYAFFIHCGNIVIKSEYILDVIYITFYMKIRIPY